MKFKRFFTIISLFLLLIFFISAISAASDENINDALSDFYECQDSIFTDETGTIGESEAEMISDSPDESITKKTNDDEVGVDAGTTATYLTPYEQFCEDLENGESTITLTGNFKVSQPFILKDSIVINGNGYTIDAQHKTNIFKAYKSLTLNNIILINGNADKGGAIYCNGDLTLDGCTFKNNVATDYGGAVLQMHGKLTVKNSKFENNKVTSSSSDGNGGAIWTYDSSSSISNSIFKSNQVLSKSLKKLKQASKYKFNGGAITYSGGSTHSITGSTFSGNKASTYGGAVFIFNCKSLNVKQSTFNSNKAAYGQGGAIYSKNTLVIDGGTFTSNVAATYGGAIIQRDGKLTVKNSKFQSNKVTNSGSLGYGGAIWIYSASSSISKTIFKSNQALSKSLKKHSKATKYKFNGGGITYSAGSSHSLTQCTFTGNKASNHGGAIFVYKSKSLSVKNTKFTSNKASFEDGGAISFSGKKLAVTNSDFKSNLAYEDGGAIDTYSLTSKKISINIKGSTFTTNTAYKGAGAIWLGVKTSSSLTNDKFTKNKASLGGAVVSETGSSKITKCKFTSNKASKVTSWTVKTKYGGKLNHCGGGVFIEKAKCKITKSTFKKNKAAYGGAVFHDTGKLTFKGNKLSGNKASKRGNKVYTPIS